MTRLIRHGLPTVFGRGMFENCPDWFAKPLMFEGFANEASFLQSSFPRVDVRESDNELKVVAEIPGMKKDDIQVMVHDGVLTISGERKHEKQETEEGILRREISRASFKRTFTLPDTLDVDKIDANYEDGLLRITFPKLEQAKPKQIEVKVR